MKLWQTLWQRPICIPCELATQLGIALAYVIAFQVQLRFPNIPGTDFAALIFIPALVRVAATLYLGPRAFFGLWAGSWLVSLTILESAHISYWELFSSAASAPFAFMMFRLLGLFPAGRDPLRHSDAMVVYLFIASYAVINAGFHLIGATMLGDPLSARLPYFPIMVMGDLIVPIGGFVAFLVVRRLFFWARSAKS